MRDTWQRTDAYEAYIGRWSREVARTLVADLPVASGSVWLDVGCGSGALTSSILSIASPARVVAFDLSAEFVQQSRRAVADTRAVFASADAAALPFRDKSADAAVSGLVLNFVPQPQSAVREMLRCVRSGGAVAAYVWDYGEGMQMLRLFWDAANALYPAAAVLDEANRFPICNRDALENLFRSVGAEQVWVTSITIPMHFFNFEDLWSPFLGGQGPAPSFAVGLPERERAVLRDRFRDLIPTKTDGSIELAAKAWVARCSV
jgi:SAM-dependent methyltransferase